MRTCFAFQYEFSIRIPNTTNIENKLQKVEINIIVGIKKKTKGTHLAAYIQIVSKLLEPIGLKYS